MDLYDGHGNITELSQDVSKLKNDFDTCFDGGTIVEKFAEANQIKASGSSVSTAEYGDDGSCTINSNGANCYFGWK